MQTIESKQGQWLGDIAVRHLGDISAIVELAVLNDISLTDDLVAGTVLVIPEIINKRVVNYLIREKIEPASAVIIADSNVNKGIGTMAIDIDFIVR